MTDEIKKGLLGIVVDETEVSKVMPEINSLTYRGYAAQDLCEYCKFEEVAYLILNKDLPNSIELKKFEKVIISQNSEVYKTISHKNYSIIQYKNLKTKQIFSVKSKYIIGCDGANSFLRRQIKNHQKVHLKWTQLN